MAARQSSINGPDTPKGCRERGVPNFTNRLELTATEQHLRQSMHPRRRAGIQYYSDTATELHYNMSYESHGHTSILEENMLRTNTQSQHKVRRLKTQTREQAQAGTQRDGAQHKVKPALNRI